MSLSPHNLSLVTRGTIMVLSDDYTHSTGVRSASPIFPIFLTITQSTFTNYPQTEAAPCDRVH